MSRTTIIRRGAGVLAIGLTALLLSACTPEQTQVQTLVNNTRKTAALRTLSDHPTMDTKAQNWAATLAKTCTLSHSTLATGAPAGWIWLGENVGLGWSTNNADATANKAAIQKVHDAFMASAGHKVNIVYKTATHQGSGVAPCANDKNRIIVVQEFAQI